MKKAFPLLLFGVGTIFLNSCGEDSKKAEIKELKRELKLQLETPSQQEAEKLKRALNAIVPKNWQIVDIFKVTPSEEPYLKKFLVRLYSPYNHALFNRFVWLTNDGKVLFLSAYLLGEDTVTPLSPPKAKEYPLENVGWILDLERILYTYNIPSLLVRGKKTLYLVWNPFCRECFNRWKDIVETAKREKLSIKLIPYHNVYYPTDNLYMLIYLLYRAQREGLYTVLNAYYSSSKNFEEFLQKLKRDAYSHLGQIPRKDYNTLGFALKEIYKVLYQAKVFSVPTTVKVVEIKTELGLAKGYVYVGEIRLK